MAKKHSFYIRNWHDYNQALVNRGSLTFWFEEKAIQGWHNIKHTGKRGRPFFYAQIAIQCMLSIREIFHLTLRATQGFVGSLIEWLQLPIVCPDYTTLCVRQKGLNVFLSSCPKKKNESLHIVVDSTGVKVFGEGEWTVRQHGYSKHRTWRKLHLAVNAKNHEIEAMVISTNDFKDSEMISPLLEQIREKIAQVTGDGGYDSHQAYQIIEDQGAIPIIPPRKDAVISQHGNCHSPPLSRDKILRTIRKIGIKSWKKKSHYFKRNLAQTAIFRLKTLFGDKLRSRTFENQAVESFLRCRALNKMTQMGMPDSYRIT